MIRRLLIAAAIALVAGPGFTFHHLGRLELPTPGAAPLGAAAAVVTLEPLLPSGHF